MDAWSGGRLVELSEDESWELLRTREVGRVAYEDTRGPVILPLSYRVHGRSVRLRTAPHSALALRIGDRRVAFEADNLDHAAKTGWSVLVLGRAILLDAPSVEDDDVPEPWAGGNRPLVIEVEAREITGRRLLPG